jgi:hypothetical protein
MERAMRVRIRLVAAAALFVASPAAAQVPNIGLSLFSPGARANAMGRAFIGVADDASAAITNPSGLVNLTRPQVYAELKSTDFEGLFAGAARERINSLSFLGASGPIGERGAVAGTMHEFLNYRDGDDKVRGVSYVASLAMSTSDRLSVGATIGVDVFTSSFEEAAYAPSFAGGLLWKASTQVSVGVAGAIGKEYFEPKRVPSRLGGGVSMRPSDRLLVAADALWIDASDPDVGSTDIVQTNFGAEFLVATGTNGLLLRGGGFFTPKKGTGGDEEFFRDAPEAAGTVGLGVTVGRRFQADLAFISTGDLILSGAFRF